MKARPLEERIQEIDTKIAQLQAQKIAIENREKAKSKKARTRLLIEYGELVEKYLKCETVEELENILKSISKK